MKKLLFALFSGVVLFSMAVPAQAQHHRHRHCYIKHHHRHCEYR